MRSTSPPSGILLAISIEGEGQDESHLGKFMTMMNARSIAHESTSVLLPFGVASPASSQHP